MVECLSGNNGPTFMLFAISSAANIAVIAPVGTPSNSTGRNPTWEAELLADSGPATPGKNPVPNFSGVFEINFSAVYDIIVDIFAPRPGKIENNPINPPRIAGKILEVISLIVVLVCT